MPTPISREKNIGVTLWKERLLSSDGHQWPPYQQNEQSSLSSLNSLNTKITMTYDIGNVGPVLANLFLIWLFNPLCREETTNTNVIVFGLTFDLIVTRTHNLSMLTLKHHQYNVVGILTVWTLSPLSFLRYSLGCTPAMCV